MKLRILRKRTEDEGIHLTIAGDMTVYSVVRLKEVLMKELKSGSGITVDLSDVNDADTSGFQLLIFLRKEAYMLGKKFKITELSPRLESIFSLYREAI